jgi:H+/gluconate symporter-like permease
LGVPSHYAARGAGIPASGVVQYPLGLTVAEFGGGPVMIIIVAVMFRLFVKQRLVSSARAQADRGLRGSMEGHAAMDMSVPADLALRRRLLSGSGLTAISHVFVMDRAAILRDVVVGLLIAGCVGPGCRAASGAASSWPGTRWRPSCGVR